MARINLFDMYTPQELARKTVMDIRDKRARETRMRRKREKEADSFLIEQGYRNRGEKVYEK